MTPKTKFLAAAVLLGTVLAGCAQPAGTPVTPNGSSSAASRSGRPLARERATKGSFFVSDLAHGDVIVMRGARQQTIGGPRTQLRSPIALAREPSGDLVVVNPRKVTAPHRPGSIVTLSAKPGDHRAKHVITCKRFSPWGVAVDSSSHIWVADGLSNSIREYAPDAERCATPLLTIQGSATGLSNPLGLAINSKGQVVVENFIDDSIEVFAAGASGNVAPVARIAGSNTQMTNSEGLAVDASDNIWITNYGAGDTPASVLEFDGNANGNVAPKRSIKGSGTQLNATIGLAIDRETGKIYVCNGGATFQTGAVLVFAPDANGNVSPDAELLPGTFPTGIILPN